MRDRQKRKMSQDICGLEIEGKMEKKIRERQRKKIHFWIKSF